MSFHGYKVDGINPEEYVWRPKVGVEEAPKFDIQQ